MTFEDFEDVVLATFSKLHTIRSVPYRQWLCGDGEGYFVEWMIDGSSGGNCWNDEPSRWHPGDPEPEVNLDGLFEKVCPNMTFTQHRKVIETVVERSERHDREYYGNYTNYGVKKVSYRKLYDVLVTEGII